MGKKSKQKIVHGIPIPKNAVLANFYKQDSDYPAGFYQDINYKCAGCGVNSSWTAIQQKKYFEEQRGNKYNTPKWCFSCHEERMKAKHQKSKQ